MLAVIMGSEFGKRLRIKKLFSILILVSCLIILGITRFNVVSFNEAFWYFILFVRYIPFIVLIETIIFIFDLD
ncbi:integral membrane protein [Lactiplantibacillus plantarum 4_3]|nr:integral membrane protein [Lactiplantibacillus plantarum 4_3]